MGNGITTAGFSVQQPRIRAKAAPAALGFPRLHLGAMLVSPCSRRSHPNHPPVSPANDGRCLKRRSFCRPTAVFTPKEVPFHRLPTVYTRYGLPFHPKTAGDTRNNSRFANKRPCDTPNESRFGRRRREQGQKSPVSTPNHRHCLFFLIFSHNSYLLTIKR